MVRSVQFMPTAEDVDELEPEWERELSSWHWVLCLSNRNDEIVIYLKKKDIKNNYV